MLVAIPVVVISILATVTLVEPPKRLRGLLLQSKHAGSVLAAFLKDLSLRALGVWEFTEFNLNPRPSLNVPKP